MELQLLDQNLEMVDVIDTFESVIWTDRFYEPGDFEIYVPYTQYYAEIFKLGYYLTYKRSDRVMIIETIEIVAHIEEGTKMTISGRSLESILDRRIIWDLLFLNTGMENAVEIILNGSIIKPSIKQRIIPNFIFIHSMDSDINNIIINGKYLGDDILEILVGMCKENHIGYKITLSDNKTFVFTLYRGLNRSYSQNDLPYVVFSFKLDNLKNADYLLSNKKYKNVTLVVGEELSDEGNSDIRKTTVVGDTAVSGLSRREVYTDAKDISSKLDDGSVMSDAQYYALLSQRGSKALQDDYKLSELFDGEMETTMTKYGVDFIMGDIVQIADVFGKSVDTEARVIEMIFSQDNNGYSEYPTFEVVN